MFRLNALLLSGGEEKYWEGRRDAFSCFQESYAWCPGPHPGSRWPASTRPARRSRTGAAHLRMGGEEESAQTGDSNPGCNYLVRGDSPSMHFFWGVDMPHYSHPLPFRRGREGCPCMLASPRGRPDRGSLTCTLLACPGPRPGSRLRTCVLAGGRAPVPGAGVAVVRAGWRAQARAPDRGRIRARWRGRARHG